MKNSLKIRRLQNYNNVFEITLSNDSIKLIEEMDTEWKEGFEKFIDIKKEYPYVTSPKSSQYISELFDSAIATFRDNFEWDVKRWFGSRETYILGILRRVLIPDTYEPIFFNTGKISNFIKELDLNRTVNIRSFFTGAAVAEKSLLIQLYKSGIKNVNLITSDYSAESQILSAINIITWNETLSQEDRYQIYVVDGEIPTEFYGRSKTIVLQIRDALYAITEENEKFKDDENTYRIDALLLDNALPYVDREFGKGLIEKAIDLKNTEGLYIAILGLDSGISVKISLLSQIREMLAGNRKEAYDVFLSQNGFDTDYGYKHFYRFVKKNETFYIKEVISSGAARIFDWLNHLLLSFQLSTLLEVMKAIKSATALSSASNIVKTSPIYTYLDILDLLKEKGVKYKFEAVPLRLNHYTNIDKSMITSNELETYNNIKNIDPVVLRSTLLRINK